MTVTKEDLIEYVNDFYEGFYGGDMSSVDIGDKLERLKEMVEDLE